MPFSDAVFHDLHISLPDGVETFYGADAMHIIEQFLAEEMGWA